MMFISKKQFKLHFNCEYQIRWANTEINIAVRRVYVVWDKNYLLCIERIQMMRQGC